MKKIGDIAKGVNLGGSGGEGGGIDADTMEVVDKLFNDLIAVFPAFKQAWPTTDVMDTAKRIWTLAFMTEGFNDLEVIKRGIVEYSLLKNPFIPTAGQFIELCKVKIAPAAHRDYIPLPKPIASDDIAKENIKKMKELVGVKCTG